MTGVRVASYVPFQLSKTNDMPFQ